MISSVFFFWPRRPINFIIIPQISGDATRYHAGRDGQGVANS